MPSTSNIDMPSSLFDTPHQSPRAIFSSNVQEARPISSFFLFSNSIFIVFFLFYCFVYVCWFLFLFLLCFIFVWFCFHQDLFHWLGFMWWSWSERPGNQQITWQPWVSERFVFVVVGLHLVVDSFGFGKFFNFLSIKNVTK